MSIYSLKLLNYYLKIFKIINTFISNIFGCQYSVITYLNYLHHAYQVQDTKVSYKTKLHQQKPTYHFLIINQDFIVLYFNFQTKFIQNNHNCDYQLFEMHLIIKYTSSIIVLIFNTLVSFLRTTIIIGAFTISENASSFNNLIKTLFPIIFTFFSTCFLSHVCK